MSDTAPDPAPARGPEFVQSLERGLAVIRAFDATSGPLSLSEVARRCGLPRAAARRFLLTLVELGYVAQEGRGFALRPRVLELGVAYLSGLSFVEVARPHLERLSADVDESASISVLDGDEVVYVARVPTRRIMSVTIAVGTRLPAWATSMGRVLLAALPEAELARRLAAPLPAAPTAAVPLDADAVAERIAGARADGFALVDEELERGLRSIAVPILDATGAAIAAINVSTPAARTTVAQLRERILPRLRRAADEIHADLRRIGPGGLT
ncbi:IclR family transcriptional regulator domain-containing protein [Patulibacter defluvii]|uniref:IclR family transcriptional regulator domain-containing protein n=1 Tax=Patulibacter defluvii TaxID=3095358 RepID=UPI002A75EAF9|nr:IclR family transcriptional regulator C-terminal domain-containing protein [Patulibacter sp. DM4]